ncbi:hypothetical protein HK101_000720 [Irineochytrium annulatum]|nr:hypothetical protein HK101_000720 [Irineochytrium annulatum]
MSFRTGRTVRLSHSSQCPNWVGNTVLALLALAPVVFLGYHEHIHKETQLGIKEAKEILEPIPDDRITDRSALVPLVNHLVQISSKHVEPSPISDLDFNLDFPGALRVRRSTEYCQWSEHHTDETHTWTDSDGEEHRETTRRYYYTKGWSPYTINSLFFDQPAAHHNPLRDPFPSMSHTAEAARVGDFLVGSDVLTSAGPMVTRKRFDHSALEAFGQSFAASPEAGRFRYVGDGYFVSKYERGAIEQLLKLAGRVLEGSLDIQLGDFFSTCEAGDIRVRYEGAVVGEKGVTVIGKLLSDAGEVGVYETKRGFKIGMVGMDSAMTSDELFGRVVSSARWWVVGARVLMLVWALILNWTREAAMEPRILMGVRTVSLWVGSVAAVGFAVWGGQSLPRFVAMVVGLGMFRVVERKHIATVRRWVEVKMGMHARHTRPSSSANDTKKSS